MNALRVEESSKSERYGSQHRSRGHFAWEAEWQALSKRENLSESKCLRCMSACYSQKKHSFIFRIWGILQKWYRPTSNPHNKIPLATSNSTRANQIRSFLLPSLGPVGPVGPVPNRSETSEQTISSAPRGSSQTCTIPDRRAQVIDCSWMISGCRICIEYVESALINKRKEISEGSGPMTSAEFCAKVACQQHQLTTAAI